jgi:D-glycero-D-manno-heptose 1,7-bisphosphate phosphatase
MKVIFLDRDGVINKDFGYVSKIGDFHFIDGVFSACNHFQLLGFKLIIVTNQSGISRGFFSIDDYRVLTDWMMSKFLERDVHILDTLHCPHSPESKCGCRKPKPGLLIEAKKKYDIDMKSSWLIGDKEDDIIAANKSGIHNTILVQSGQRIDEQSTNAKFILKSIHKSIGIINK